MAQSPENEPGQTECLSEHLSRCVVSARQKWLVHRASRSAWLTMDSASSGLG